MNNIQNLSNISGGDEAIGPLVNATLSSRIEECGEDEWSCHHKGKRGLTTFYVFFCILKPKSVEDFLIPLKCFGEMKRKQYRPELELLIP